MSKSGSEPMLWAPRHSGWNLAHHLLPSFVLLAFLAGTGVYALLHERPVLSTGLLASALAVLMGVVAAYRRPTADQAAGTEAVGTSTGPRAATCFPMFRTSPQWAAAVMGLAVVILVATVALSARLLIIHSYDPMVLIVLLTIFLLGIGVYVLNRGIRMARIAAASQDPGVYLTRSRIVLHSSRGTREIYWNDLEGIEPTDPARHRPLGKRGPAWIVVRPRAGDAVGAKPLVILVHELTANPDQLMRTLEHYWANPADRAELGTAAALERVRGFEPLP
ncbi:hypothetical protein GCM10009715_02920 [Paeniglutamicibacter psychrophenolicus]|uniref:Mn2+ efflux pump MntP n=1 Tax=Paeniglutamicibacter psychrophenolicus TaxID=257454 RepID=A0ABS4WB05_9MICC|nr:hypothetical protein [Paeniglutamicibacter psychrophenolicus]MBP2373385.1 putative Mn2+ efflux pump MntP [Paeniglutamicibacter psychrophenolicus]